MPTRQIGEKARAGDLEVLAIACQKLNLHQEAADYLFESRVLATPTVLTNQSDIRLLLQEAEALLELQ